MHELEVTGIKVQDGVFSLRKVDLRGNNWLYTLAVLSSSGTSEVSGHLSFGDGDYQQVEGCFTPEDLLRAVAALNVQEIIELLGN